MKKYSEALFYILPIVAIAVTFVIVFSWRKYDHNRKLLAYDQVVSNELFADTLIKYELYQDSITVQFENPIRFKDWYGEIVIAKKGEFVVVDFPNRQPKRLGKMSFSNDPVTFTGFHLTTDSIENYSIRMDCRLASDRHMISSKISLPGYLFHSDKERPGFLYISELVDDFNMEILDLDALNAFPTHIQAFCMDSFGRRYMNNLYSLY